MWRIAKETGQKLDTRLPDNILDYPSSVLTAVMKRMQIDSFFELPEDKRPPETIWDNAKKLKDWFDSVFERKERAEMVINIPDSEIE